MPDKDEIFRIWAPPESVWSPWVKPVLFAFTDRIFNLSPERSVPRNWDWVPRPSSTAFILDLPEEEAVLCSLRLAEKGYRPVPLYNALPFAISEKVTSPSSRPASTVHVEPILCALVREAATLEKIHLPPNAPPAFLLDSLRRLARTDIRPGIFDNRSVCFSTDFPSEAFLLEHGIRDVVVVQEALEFAPDLLSALVVWQATGIQIKRKLYRDFEPAVSVKAEPPSFLRKLWLRLRVAVGFHRAELGGFGEIVRPSGG